MHRTAAEELLHVEDSPANGGFVITIFPGINLQSPPPFRVKVCVVTSNVVWLGFGATPPIVSVAPVTIPVPVTVRMFDPALFLDRAQLSTVGGEGHGVLEGGVAADSQVTVTTTPCSLP
ncbi:MAG TPA: hypothetical protein VI756_10685, partial [Blastocatellia bacterium]